MKSEQLTTVEISRTALRHQVRLIKGLIGDVALYPVLKSNAYGHGVHEVAEILDSDKAVAGFYVVSLDEALALKKYVHKPVSILSFWQRNETMVRAGIRYGISFPVYDPGQARWLHEVAEKMKRKALVQIKADVGTLRIGFRYDESVNDICRIFRLSGLRVVGLFSHFADSENSDESFTKKQEQRFVSLVNELMDRGCEVRNKHIACSAATLRKAEYHYDSVRIGISLYGMWPSDDVRKISDGSIRMKPILTWKTKIIQIKTVKAGESVGYGMTYRAMKKTRIAVLPIGYWDGYDRKFSNKGKVLIQGIRCSVRGNVCMNLTMVELPQKISARVGDEVVLLGAQKKERITAEELADMIGTINYEITTRINPLIPRILV